MERIKYAELNSRQKESYNFHKLAAILADFGYTSLWLNDDYLGADFIAVGLTDVRKVQLKSRFTVDKKYAGKSIFVAAPIQANWYLYPHDATVQFLEERSIYVGSVSWANGAYSTAAPSPHIIDFLAQYRLDGSTAPPATPN